MIARAFVKFFVVVQVILLTFFISTPIQAAESKPAVLPNFEKFISAVTNGQGDVVRGVYVPNVLALRVQQQLVGNAGYVSAAAGVVTQFQMAADLGVTGFLGHNYVAGKTFFNLAVGDEVRVVYGDGLVKIYLVSEIYQYQALEPNNPYGHLVDLNTNARVSMVDVFNTMYAGDDHVTFQTCIAKGRNLAWGRLFVVATPKQ